MYAGEWSDSDPLLTRAEVAAIFRVTEQTVMRWDIAGKLRSVRTWSGELRYRQSEVRALLQCNAVPRQRGPSLFS